MSSLHRNARPAKHDADGFQKEREIQVIFCLLYNTCALCCVMCHRNIIIIHRKQNNILFIMIIFFNIIRFYFCSQQRESDI